MTVRGRDYFIMDVIVITELGLDFERISTASRPPFYVMRWETRGLGFGAKWVLAET